MNPLNELKNVQNFAKNSDLYKVGKWLNWYGSKKGRCLTTIKILGEGFIQCSILSQGGGGEDPGNTSHPSPNLIGLNRIINLLDYFIHSVWSNS